MARKPLSKPRSKSARFTVRAADAVPVVQQDERGYQAGDVVAGADGSLGIVRGFTANPPALDCERIDGDAGGLDTAMQAFRRFTAHGVGSIETMQQQEAPGVVYVLGDLVDVSYEAKRGGKVNTFLHRFKDKSRPRLAVSHDGTTLYILGGGYRVTSHGIVG